MATVKTDSRHYADIAAKIRERTGAGSTYKPSEMPAGVDVACNKAYADGLDTGRIQGRQAERAERDEQDAQYLADINEKVAVYGVNGADTLSDVPQSIEDVHNKGTQAGYEGGLADGYEQGHGAGITEGTQAENDRFWEAFQQGGTRTDYSWSFRYWDTDYIRPKYKVQNITQRSDYFFQYTSVKKIEAAYFDFSGIDKLLIGQDRGSGYAIFNACRQLEEIEDLNIPAVDYYGTWNNCVSLKKIAVVRCAAGKTFTLAFNNCHALEDVTFTGTVNTNGLDLQHSINLSKASIESVLGVLSASVSGRTVTLSKEAVNKAFETVSGANDGSSSDAWAVLIQTKPSWTISLV